MVDRKKTSEELFREAFSSVRNASGESMQEVKSRLEALVNAVRAEAELDLAGRADAAYLRALDQADEHRKMHYFRHDASAAMNGMIMTMFPESFMVPNITDAQLELLAHTSFKLAKAMRDEAEKVAIEERR